MTHARAALCSALATVLLAAAALALGAGAAHAAWSNDPAANLRFAPSAANQSFTIVTHDGAGGAFIAWVEFSDIRLQHLGPTGLAADGWPAAGITICAASGSQYPTSIAPDGAGGCLVAWDDYRGGSADPYVQRVNAAGTPLWTANGVAACGQAASQYNTRVVSDRAGGAIVAWTDERDFGTQSTDIYAQRVSVTGATQWGSNGIAVVAIAGDQQGHALLSDGTPGGAYFAWRDARTGFGDLYVMRLDGSGAARPGWAGNGNAIAAVPGDVTYPSLAGDGGFGCYVAWGDSRGSSFDAFVVRLTPQGVEAAGWPISGLNVTSGFESEYEVLAAPDGAGGVVMSWAFYTLGTYDVRAQRVNGAGTPLWTAGGAPVCLAPGDEYGLRLVGDGAGGGVMSWYDQRAGYPPMVFAQRLLADGSVAPGFAPDGNAVTTGSWVQQLDMCSDGAGGAICVWQNNGSPQTGLAQRIDRWGQLGAQPRIASVKDVPNDQGGTVKVSWDRSPLDAWPDNRISNYLVYRSVPPNAALAALESGSAVLSDDAATGPRATAAAASAPGKRAFVTTSLAGATVYWEQVGNVYATQLAGYSFLAPTAQDSVPGSAPRTLFMVRAEDWSVGARWDSDPDSAYSTDDLAPAAPAPFTGNATAGTTYLHWQPNAEPDLAHYRLYRGTSAGFVPGPGNLVAAPPDTGHADAGAVGFFYKLTAVDSHGNESAASLLTPSGTLAVEGALPAALALAPATPNPSRGATTCRFALPAPGAVRLEVFDAAGRLVRVLADGEFAPGEHAVRWDGTGEGGARVPNGLYLARLQFGGRTLTGKIARVE